MLNWEIGIYLVIYLYWVVYYTYLWQLKEYRWDRMSNFLGSNTGLKRFLPWPFLVRLFFLIVTLLLVKELPFTWLWTVVELSWIADLIYLVFRLLKHQLFRPEKTLKALLILIGNGALVIFCWWLIIYGPVSDWFAIINGGSGLLLDSDKIIALNLLALLIPLFNSLVIMAFYPITLLMKWWVMKRARAKMALMKKLKVIGITGSYGKSSTKEFLTKILADKFKILATPGNTNTDIGVAGIILNDLRPEHEVFIVEMGAYRRGEIKKICDLVAPHIGIVTAVQHAHLALFGSMENIKRAKFELIESLPRGSVTGLDWPVSTGIFNLDNEGSAQLYEQAERSLDIKIIGYTSQEIKGAKRNIINANDVEIETEKVEFIVDDVSFEAHVFGEQNIPNLLATIAAAREMGMTLPEISSAFKNIEIVRKTMNLKKTSEELWIIDDTYNANPEGVMAALNYLELFKKRKKLVVFPGMQELGLSSDSQHRRVGQKIAEICSAAIFSSKEFKKSLTAGIEYCHDKKLEDGFYFIEDDQEAIYDKLRQIIDKQKAIVLFISRGADEVIKKLSKK